MKSLTSLKPKSKSNQVCICLNLVHVLMNCQGKSLTLRGGPFDEWKGDVLGLSNSIKNWDLLDYSLQLQQSVHITQVKLCCLYFTRNLGQYRWMVHVLISY